MTEVVDRPSREPAHGDGPPTPMRALFWRLFVGNGLVFAAGAAVLVLSPATVSEPVTSTEIGVLAVGLALMLALNAALTHAALRPLDGLTALMRRVDLLRPGQRLEVGSAGDVTHLLRGFNAMLDRLEAERGQAAARALSAQEGERQRIARELHDEIGQSLTAVLLGLKRSIDLAPDALRDELVAVQETVRSAVDEVRHVARRLRPGVLEDLGLASAVTTLGAEAATTSGVAVRRRIDDPLPPLRPEAELVVYRVAQEALTNVARHAAATTVVLELLAERGGVLLRVSDDGRGVTGAAEGAGIRGMRERALLVDATLSVREAEGGGTVVALHVPAGAERAR